MRLIRPYDPRRDEPHVYHLWAQSFSRRWPLSQVAFRHVTVGNDVYQPGDHLVAEVDEEVVGFAATQTMHVPDARSPRGYVMVILVAPAYQRQGIGRSLLEQALESLRLRGVAMAQIGGGSSVYFWPGVPANLPGAWSFFQACGWSSTESSFDLVRDLRDYVTPPGVMARLERHDIRIRMVRPTDRHAVLAFELRHFPEWLSEFERAFKHGDDSDVLIVTDAIGSILGTALILDPRSKWRHPGFVWTELLGTCTGGLGVLGVAETYRRQGIGLALAARTTEILRDRGLVTSYISWAYLVDWYARLEYGIWQRYRMSWKYIGE